MKKRHLSVIPPYQDNKPKDQKDESGFDIKLAELEKHIKQEDQELIQPLSFVSEIKRLLKLMFN